MCGSGATDAAAETAFAMLVRVPWDVPSPDELHLLSSDGLSDEAEDAEEVEEAEEEVSTSTGRRRRRRHRRRGGAKAASDAASTTATTTLSTGCGSLVSECMPRCVTRRLDHEVVTCTDLGLITPAPCTEPLPACPLADSWGAPMPLTVRQLPMAPASSLEPPSPGSSSGETMWALMPAVPALCTNNIVNDWCYPLRWPAPSAVELAEQLRASAPDVYED